MVKLPESFELEILEEDLNNGKPKNALRCPVSRAARRFFLEKFGETLDDITVSVTLVHSDGLSNAYMVVELYCEGDRIMGKYLSPDLYDYVIAVDYSLGKREALGIDAPMPTAMTFTQKWETTLGV